MFSKSARSGMVPDATMDPEASMCQIEWSTSAPADETTHTPPDPSDTNGPPQQPGPGLTGSPTRLADRASNCCVPSFIRNQTVSRATLGMYAELANGRGAWSMRAAGSGVESIEHVHFDRSVCIRVCSEHPYRS